MKRALSSLRGDAGDSFDERRESYRSELEAAKPGNRFMRRRSGTYSQVERTLTPMALWNVCQTARHMVRNDALPGQMLERLADNIVQGGFRFVPNTGDTALDADLSAIFLDWSNDPSQCDFFGERSLAEQTWMSLLQVAQDGDGFFLFLDDGRLQYVEFDRCVGPDPFMGGVIVDGARVTGYRFSETIPMCPFASASETETYNILDDQGNRQVAHLYCAKRMSQHRGYSWLHPIMMKAGMLDDLEFATVVKAQTAASIAGVAERTDKSSLPIAPALGRQMTPTTSPNGESETMTEMRGGAIIDLPYGRKLTGWAPVVPNSEHFQHTMHIIKEMGAAVNMPIEMVLLDSGISNFSGTRMAMANARMSFRRIQKTWIASFLSPMIRWKIRQWLPRLGRAAMRMELTGNIFRHKWVEPSWSYIQPVEEATGTAIELENNTASPREVVARQGRSYDDVVRETCEDNGAMVLAALKKTQEILAAYPDADVNWREIARMRLPNGMVQTGMLPDPNKDPSAQPATKSGPQAPNRTAQHIAQASQAARDQILPKRESQESSV